MGTWELESICVGLRLATPTVIDGRLKGVPLQMVRNGVRFHNVARVRADRRMHDSVNIMPAYGSPWGCSLSGLEEAGCSVHVVSAGT